MATGLALELGVGRQAGVEGAKAILNEAQTPHGDTRKRGGRPPPNGRRRFAPLQSASFTSLSPSGFRRLNAT